MADGWARRAATRKRVWRKKRRTTLRCLLRGGADVKAENSWRETALRIAKRKRYSACVEILKEPPPPPPRPLP